VEGRKEKGLLVIHQSSVLKKRAKSGFRSLSDVWKGRRRQEVGFLYHQGLRDLQLEAQNSG